MNLNFPFCQKTTKIPITQIEYTFTYQKTELSQILGRDDPYAAPNIFPIQMVLDVRRTSEPTGKKAQMTLSDHKWSSMTYRHQKLLANCPNSTFVLTNVSPYWRPTPVLLPGKSHGWRNLEGCSPWGR